jgi:hypothetical protein
MANMGMLMSSFISFVVVIAIASIGFDLYNKCGCKSIEGENKKKIENHIITLSVMFSIYVIMSVGFMYMGFKSSDTTARAAKAAYAAGKTNFGKGL